MSIFQSVRVVPCAVRDLAPVASATMRHFESQGYEVAGQETLIRGWDISIHKGGTFKAVVGMKTALKIEIHPAEHAVTVRASVGIFGQQAVPTAISMLIFWPILLTQLWGLVRQSKLDDEALGVVEANLRAAAAASGSVPVAAGGKYCDQCGGALRGGERFCPSCGARL